MRFIKKLFYLYSKEKKELDYYFRKLRKKQTLSDLEAKRVEMLIDNELMYR